ncbi:MAG: hypothetical protein ACI9DC_000500 [Gammaproteobacteria bacterium]|jgi:hypothetical protein
MSTQLLLEITLVVVAAIVALPLIGQFLAMALGMLVTIRRRRCVAAGKGEHNRLDALEARLRRAARALGCRLIIDHAADGNPQHLRTEARSICDRRFGERRVKARRWQARKDSNRRFRERRARGHRRQFR